MQKEVIELKKKIEQKQRLIKKHEVQLDKYYRELRSVCDHFNQKIDRVYFSGSYFDHASTSYTLKCEDCGQVLKRWEETHSWYG